MDILSVSREVNKKINNILIEPIRRDSVKHTINFIAQKAKGAALYEHIIKFFMSRGILKENCIGFASDGENNMMGAQNSVVNPL